jgi:hypothetical protein
VSHPQSISPGIAERCVSTSVPCSRWKPVVSRLDVIYKIAVHRLAFLFIVGFLIGDASGIDWLVLPERCTSPTDTQPDNSCPATCSRCACCSQPLVNAPATVLVHIEYSQPVAEHVTYHVLPARPDDIFHIPKAASLTA